MKLYTQIEQIFRFRLLNNSDIDAYLRRMSNMGKLDEVRKNDLLRLILTRLGEIEDQEVMVPPFNSGTYTIDTTLPSTTTTNTADTIKEVETFKCPDCDMVAKSKLGLSSHVRNKHKKVL